MCDHTLNERESECSDGACPICLAEEVERLRAENAVLKKYPILVRCDECGHITKYNGNDWQPIETEDSNAKED